MTVILIATILMALVGIAGMAAVARPGGSQSDAEDSELVSLDELMPSR